MLSIPRVQVLALFKELKEKYGVKQTAIAEILGVSRQAVTDMKSGRRRFTRVMAENLIQAFVGEPWIGWLRERLDSMFAVPSTRVILSGELPSQTAQKQVYAEPGNAGAISQSTSTSWLPVLTSPHRGDPTLSSANTQKYILLPDELSSQTAESDNAYILVVDCDSLSGRLRRGDLVLVLQDAERESEIMIIEHGGALRLARRGGYERVFGDGGAVAGDESDWYTLDSGMGISARKAKPAGCVVGIVMALL